MPMRRNKHSYVLQVWTRAMHLYSRELQKPQCWDEQQEHHQRELHSLLELCCLMALVVHIHLGLEDQARQVEVGQTLDKS